VQSFAQEFFDDRDPSDPTQENGQMSEVRLGVNLWSQSSDWPAFLAAGRHAEELGYDHLWTWDHIYAIFGDPYQPIFEGYTALAAMAQATSRIRLGLFVGRTPSETRGLR
jgi:alkanesulfonate monooxygenase SsuD/methylene tetrahydromethanopterin reductase-like flavin-dependent oxidoreductase (luciferase family)